MLNVLKIFYENRYLEHATFLSMFFYIKKLSVNKKVYEPI